MDDKDHPSISSEHASFIDRDFSVPDTDYAVQHNLPELVDMLIYQVSITKPKHPAAYMSLLLRERIAAREGTNARSANPLLTASPAVQMKRKLPVNEMDSSLTSASPLGSSQAFERFGIWIHVHEKDVPIITHRFEDLCNENNVIRPKEFSRDMEKLLRNLAGANAAFYYKGAAESIKMVLLQPHVNAPTCCDYLTTSILNVATVATLSQRNSLSTFMSFIADALHVDDDAKGTQQFWECLKNSSVYDESFVTNMKAQARRFCLLSNSDAHIDLYLQWLNAAMNNQTMSSEQRLTMMRSTYKQLNETSLPRLPDRFAMFAGLVLCNLNETPGATEPSSRTLAAISKVLYSMLEDENIIVNEIATSSASPNNSRVRKGDPEIINFFSRYFSRAFQGKYQSCGEQGTGMTLERLLSTSLTNADDRCESFATVCTAVLALNIPLSEEESYIMRCNNSSRAILLKFFAKMVELRRSLLVDEVKYIMIQTRCCSVTIETFSVYLSEALRLTGLPMQTVNEAKSVIEIFLQLCASANTSPLVNEFSVSIRTLIEAVEESSLFANPYDTVPALHDVSPLLRARFFDLNGVLKHLSKAFDPEKNSGEALEEYAELCHLIATRTRMACIDPLLTFSFLPMTALSCLDKASEKVPLHSLFFACEALSGLCPSLHLPRRGPLCAADRTLLRNYFKNNRGLRALVKAVDMFLETFPHFAPRISRRALSYERVQRQFYTRVLKILSMETEEERDTVLKQVAVDLAVWGMLPSDYDLFGPVLSFTMRSPSFPEAIWNTFFSDCLERVRHFTPSIRPLKSFSEYPKKMEKVLRAQRFSKRWAQNHTGSLTKEDARLSKALIEKWSNENVDDNFDEVVDLTATEAALISLSWKLTSSIGKATAVYQGVRATMSASELNRSTLRPLSRSSSHRSSSRPSSRTTTPVESLRRSSTCGASSTSLGSSHSTVYHMQHMAGGEARELLKKCKVVAGRLTTFIDVICNQNKGKNWATVWSDRFNSDFMSLFDSLIERSNFMVFAMKFIDVVRKESLLQHSIIRPIWATFCSCFQRVIAINEVVQPFGNENQLGCF